MITVLTTVLGFVGLMTGIFYKAMIIFRELSFSFTFIDQISAAVGGLSELINIPGLAYLFYPMQYGLSLLSLIEIDLGAVNVTCAGASAPIELFFNLVIMGICIIVIESDYQLFRSITFANVSEMFFEATLQPNYRLWARRENGKKLLKSSKGDIRYALTILSIFLVNKVFSFDIAQSVLQYLMSFLVVQEFVAAEGLHPYDAECNVVDGYKGLDTILSYIASVEAWIIFMPAFYEVSKILIPGVPPRISSP